jgi:hypothetical protein
MAQDTPYFPRDTKADQDLGGLNQNFRDLSDRGKDNVGGADVPGNKCWGTDALCYDDALSTAKVGPNGLRFDDGTSQTTAFNVSASTGFAITFSATLGFTSAQTSFTPSSVVTGSKGTFTVIGTTVNCTLSGSVSNGGGTWVYVGIGVDGAVNNVPGTSTTIGLSNQYPATNGAGYPITFDYSFQVTPGQHSFYIGIWTNSGTNTFPAASGSVAQFKCKEGL